MTSAGPDFAAVLTQWTFQPVAVVVGAALTAWYASAVRAATAQGAVWPARRSVVFAVGVVLFVWTTCGVLQVYLRSLFWIWTAQTLVLLLIAPLVLLFGRPVELSRMRTGRQGLVDRVVRSRFGRTMSSPLVGPALVPLLSAVLFFGPLPGWAIGSTLVGWVLQPLLVLVGGMIVLPLVDSDDRLSSLAVGLGLAIGSFELVLDAIPGIALRLHTTLVTSYFDHRQHHDWSPTPLHDQQIGGAILWCVAEVIDLPFLLLVYRRWLRADAREAAATDAVLEAERLARTGLDPDAATSRTDPTAPAADAPWWLSDPAMQKRFHHRD